MIPIIDPTVDRSEALLHRMKESNGEVAAKVEMSGCFVPQTAYIYEAGRNESYGKLAILMNHSENGVSHEIVEDAGRIWGLLDDGVVEEVSVDEIPFEEYGEERITVFDKKSGDADE